MPLNPGSFLFPIQNLGPDFGKFFGAYNEQQKRGEEREMALANNAMAKLKAERYPDILNAEVKKTEAEALRAPFVGLQGPAAQIQSLEMIKNIYGEKSPQYTQALNMFDLERQNTISNINARDIYAGLAPTKALSPEAKSYAERRQILDGHIPGTEIEIPQAQRQILVDQMDLAQLKRITDPKTRDKVSSAINIDKTIESFKPKALTYYSGPGGAARLKLAQAADASGNGSEEYKEYLEAVTGSEFLANQVRQFYQGSVVPSAMEHLYELSNPSAWNKSPDAALRQYNQAINILKNETGTLRNMLYSTKELVPKEGRLEGGHEAEPQEDTRASDAFSANKRSTADDDDNYSISREFGVPYQDIVDTRAAGWSSQQIRQKLKARGQK
jgi:hypothetical protein